MRKAVKIETFEDMSQHMIRFLKGEIPESPCHMGELEDETKPYVAPLVAMNVLGFVTMCSQPGLRKRELLQRSYVVGLAREEVAMRLYDVVNLTGMIAMAYKISDLDVPRVGLEPDRTGAVVVTLEDDRHFTFVGRYGFELCWWERAGMTKAAMKKLAAELWELTLIDPVWGRDPMDRDGLFMACLEIARPKP